MNNKIDPEVVDKLFEESSSNKILKEALGLLSLDEKNWKRATILAVICIVPTIKMAISVDTIQLFLDTLNIINNVMIALFGIVFTGYAFFQALVNDELLIWMLGKEKNSKKCRLQESNEYFVKLMILQGLSIFVNVFMLILLNTFPKEWSLFKCNAINNFMAGIFICIYMMFNFQILCEIKCFVFNLFQLFNAHAGAKALKIFSKDNNVEDK